jgi:C1A family cysteine protease
VAACSARACASLVGYFERRAHGKREEGSSLFLYKMTRVLLGRQGDTGAPLRATLKALVRFGLPPCRLCPNLVEHFDDDPPAFLFAYARDYQGAVYLRLHDASSSDQTLAQVKSFLAAGFPAVFGFMVCDTLQADGAIPFPSCFDRPLGGVAAVAVGYDDRQRVSSERGALRVLLPWGDDWGENGYGWLPYRYVFDNLAADFWTLLRPDWLASGEFLNPF